MLKVVFHNLQYFCQSAHCTFFLKMWLKRSLCPDEAAVGIICWGLTTTCWFSINLKKNTLAHTRLKCVARCYFLSHFLTNPFFNPLLRKAEAPFGYQLRGITMAPRPWQMTPSFRIPPASSTLCLADTLRRVSHPGAVQVKYADGDFADHFSVTLAHHFLILFLFKLPAPFQIKSYLTKCS